MDVILAGHNIDHEIIEEFQNVRPERQDLTPETKKVWMEVWNGVSMELRKEMLDMELKNREIWKSKGGTVITPDIPAFRAAMKDVWKKFAPKAWGEGFYERIQAVR